MAAKQANAAQRKWMEDITDWASDNIALLYGLEWANTPIQRHHVLGRSAKHNKVAIGHEFILPVPFPLHDVSSNHQLNVTHRKKAFTNHFGMQRDLFLLMLNSMWEQGYTLPNPEICEAIRGTSA